MKYLAAFSVLLLACAGAQAQKVDLDRFQFSVENYRLPAHYVPPAQRTYALNIVRSPMARGMVSAGEASAALRIAGYQEKAPEDAMVHIEVALGNLLFEHSEVVAHPQLVKDKDDKVVDTTWTYSVNAVFRSAGGYTIAGPGSTSSTSGSNNPFLNGRASSSRRDVREVVNTGGVVQHSTPTFKSRKEAERQFLLNRDGIAASLYTDFIGATLRAAASRANALYGYVPVREEHSLWILDYKKHPEYRAQQDAIAAVRTVTARMRADDPREDFASELASVIEYFQSLPQKFTGGDERSRKLRYSAHYNLATLYLALDRPDLAEEEARKLVLNAFDTKDGKRLMERAEELAARLAKHQMNGHFARH
jgi:hypothetical protein